MLVILTGIFMVTVSPASASYGVRYDYEGHWAEQTIRTWIERGDLTMYGDGTFRPDQPVTRAELLSLINRMFSLAGDAPVPFPDVSVSDWYYGEVSAALEAGYITGESSGLFRPERPVTREEAAAMLGRLIFPGMEVSGELPGSLWDLNRAGDYSRGYLEDLVEQELMEGYQDKTVRPDQELTRAEAVTLLERVGVRQNLGTPWYRDRVVVLMYHSLRTDYQYDHCIHQEVFLEHLRMLTSSGFNLIRLEDFMEFLDGTSGVPPNAVLITFDDGYEDFYRLAWPLLKEREIPATMFMITSTIGDKDGYNPKLDPAQMEAVSQLVSFQSHSHDGHRYVPAVEGGEDAFLVTRIRPEEGLHESAEEYIERVSGDLRTSRQVLDRLLSQRTRALAPPYGRSSRTLQELAVESGFDFLFTIRPGVAGADTDPLSIPRINAGYSSIRGTDLKNRILSAVRVHSEQ